MTRFQEIIELIKATIWPVMVVALIVIYRKAISRFLNLSNKLSIGDFSLEIEKRTKVIGRLDIYQDLKKLSSESLKFLFGLEPNENNYPHLISSFYGPGAKHPTTFGLPTKEKMKIYYELEANGFIEFNEPLANFHQFWNTQKIIFNHTGEDLLISEAVDSERIKKMAFHLTKKGLLAMYMVFDTVADLLKNTNVE
jgi:hypothetical protein